MRGAPVGAVDVGHDHGSVVSSRNCSSALSGGFYAISQILETEKTILEVLEWRTYGPTLQEFLCLILGLLDPESYGYDLSALRYLLGDARYACELASADYGTSSSCLPSSVELASVIYSLDRVDDTVL